MDDPRQERRQWCENLRHVADASRAENRFDIYQLCNGRFSRHIAPGGCVRNRRA